MSLKHQLQTEVLEALKKGDATVSSVLRMALAAITSKEKEKRYKLSKEKPTLDEAKLNEESELSGEELIGVLTSEIKKRKDAITLYVKGGRKELAEKEQKEIEILSKYLPSQLAEEELKAMVISAIDEAGAKGIKEMGKVMGALAPKVKGRADGGVVSAMVKKLLQK